MYLCLILVVVGICNPVDSSTRVQSPSLVQMIHCGLKCKLSVEQKHYVRKKQKTKKKTITFYDCEQLENIHLTKLCNRHSWTTWRADKRIILKPVLFRQNLQHLHYHPHHVSCNESLERKKSAEVESVTKVVCTQSNFHLTIGSTLGLLWFHLKSLSDRTLPLTRSEVDSPNWYRVI